MSESNIHDRFFKKTMSNIETAKDIIKNYLPPDIVQKLKLDTLKISKNSFIDEDNKEHESDTLYEVYLDEEQIYLYFLFEHKSYNDKYVSLQLLKYMYNIWMLDKKQKKDILGNLRPILPFVFYSGESGWVAGNALSDIMNSIPKCIEKYIPNYEFELLNLKQKNFEEIKGDLETQIKIKIMKIVFMKDMDKGKRFVEILNLIKLLKKSKEAVDVLSLFKECMNYVLRAAKYMKLEEIEQSVKKEIPEWGGDYMTIAEMYVKRGKKEGREEGERLGREAGRQIEKKESAKKMLRDGIDKTFISKYLELSFSELDTLETELKNGK